MPIAKLFAPCFQKREQSNPPETCFNTDGQQEPEIFGWRVNPPLKSKSNNSFQETSTKFRSTREAKIKPNQSYFEIQQSWLSTLGATGTSEMLSSSIARIISTQHDIFAQHIPLPSSQIPSTSTKRECVSIQMHTEPETLNIKHGTVLSIRNDETLI